MRLRARAAFLALILLSLATVAGISIRKVMEQERAWSAMLMERDPQFLHCERMQVAASQAALDALALTNAPADAALQSEYQHERRQLQADWMGIEQLAARDPQRQGLLLEIRASQSDFMAALDQATTSATQHSSNPATPATNRATPLLVALQRAQRALSNYSGSLEQDAARTAVTPAAAWVNGIWISLTLLFMGCAAMVVAWESTRRKYEVETERHRQQGMLCHSAEAVLDEAFSGISQMLQLVHACTELGQLASSRDSGAMSVCDLHALTQQTVEALQPLARAAQVQLQLQATPVSVAANEFQIRQILQFVLHRAIHVSPPASTLQIRFDDSEEALQIHVIDQGQEAASKALLHCLEGAFPDSPTPTLADLNAIALSLGNKLLRRYGGSLWATRNAEQGLAVHLRLPH